MLTGLACDNSSVSLWNNMALVYAYANSPGEAQTALEQATALNATHPVVSYNVAVLSGAADPALQPQFSLYIPLPGAL